MEKYELIESNGGMGGPGDGRSKTVAYFTSLEKAFLFLSDNNICVTRNNENIDIDLDQTLHVKDGHRGLGSCWYRLQEIKSPTIKVNPKRLEDLKL